MGGSPSCHHYGGPCRGMSMSPVAYLCPCHMSSLRNNHVACHCDFYAPVVSLRPHVSCRI